MKDRLQELAYGNLVRNGHEMKIVNDNVKVCWHPIYDSQRGAGRVVGDFAAIMFPAPMAAILGQSISEDLKAQLHGLLESDNRNQRNSLPPPCTAG